MSFFNARVEAVLLYFGPSSPYNARVEAVVLFLAPPVNTHQSYDVARLRAHQKKIGELMCGSVARKAFHKAE